MTYQPVPFPPLRTERLLIRRPVLSDAEAAFARRSLPEVGQYQDWVMPYTRERAERSTEIASAMVGPDVDKTWNITVTDADDPAVIVGDLAVELRWAGRVGYIGYTFHPDYWGRGYATEATEALVEYLFNELGVTRIESDLDPRNIASARVLEACGLVFEGLTHESFWVGDECSSDMLYGMTRAGWDAWRNRPRHRPERVDLVPVTPANATAVGQIATHRSQERFVPNMLGNFRDALVPPIIDGSPTARRYRAIEADGELVGFVMVTEVPRPRVLRLLIDRMHQRRGIGSAVLDRVEAELRASGAESVEVEYAEGPGSPAGFFRGRGYEPVGSGAGGLITAITRL